MIAECDGPAARLASAYPNAGFRYPILTRGPAEVKVWFTRLGEDAGTAVAARCAAGVPHFSTSGYEPDD